MIKYLLAEVNKYCYKRIFMKNIIFYARLVKIISYAFIPAISIGFFIKWLSPEISLVNPDLIELFCSYNFNNDTLISSSIPTMPLINRLAGMLVDSIFFGLLIIIFWLILKIMTRLQNNDFFSPSTVKQFTRISKYAFYLSLYAPIDRTILSVISTLHVKPHTLTISFLSSDLFNIFIFGFLTVITLLMQQATELQQEQSLTV